MANWKYQGVPEKEAKEAEGIVRRFIISTFELLCLAGVIIPTIVAVVVGIVMTSQDGRHYLFAVMVVIGTFLLAAFVCGAALTLSDIARSTRRTAESLQRLENRAIKQSAD